jgi:hypothetical protein
LQNSKENKIEALTDLAIKAKDDKKFDSAIAYYEEILSINPGDPVAKNKISELRKIKSFRN